MGDGGAAIDILQLALAKASTVRKNDEELTERKEEEAKPTYGAGKLGDGCASNCERSAHFATLGIPLAPRLDGERI
jgi:hypothetical protein